MGCRLMRLFLGTHEPSWLGRVAVPLFVSHRRLVGRRGLPRALGEWALDSGGFSELSLAGGWSSSPAEYTAAVRRYRDEIGGLVWAAPQDWMCEPEVVGRTGLSVGEHQRRAVANLVELRGLDGSLPFVPVLQGWRPGDYSRCVDLYTAAGVDLTAEAVVGLGSVCRRQASGEIADIAATLAARGVRLHGFGVKSAGLRRFGAHLVSADSMAWSYAARRSPRLPGHTHGSCANCPVWALRWYERTVGGLEPAQLPLWGAPGPVRPAG